MLDRSVLAPRGIHVSDENPKSTTDDGEEIETEIVDDEAEPDLLADVDEKDLDIPLPLKASIVPKKGEASLARLDPFAAYMREVQRHRLLTPDETRDLAVRYVETQDPTAAAKLVTSNLRLVVKLAYEYRRAYKNIMDLVQEGNIGLMQAVKRYDPYRGVKLSSYAAWWIRAYMLRFILNNWRLVKVGTTQNQRRLFFNLQKTKAQLEAMGITPTAEVVAKELGVPESDVVDMDIRLSAGEKSLDAPLNDSDGRSVSRGDLLASTADGPEVLAAGEELQTMLKDKLAVFRLSLLNHEKELAIFDDRLVADEPLTLQELGDRYNISRERVRQIEQRVTSRLRDFLKQELGDATDVS